MEVGSGALDGHPLLCPFDPSLTPWGGSQKETVLLEQPNGKPKTQTKYMREALQEQLVAANPWGLSRHASLVLAAIEKQHNSFFCFALAPETVSF